MKTISEHELSAFFEGLLQPEPFKDYAPNGLQVQGTRRIGRIVSGVTASKALIEAALQAHADAVFVHHGLFWQGEPLRVTGWLRNRLALLLNAGMHLYAYHLPLDAHAELGNNAQLAARLGFLAQPQRFGPQNLGWVGTCPKQSLVQMARHCKAVLGREVIAIGDPDKPIQRLAWCSGGAQSYFAAAIALGVDAFITGEISEPQAHYARETGVAYLACGHHATERYGVAAVAAHAAAHFGLQHRFIDIDNPA